MATVLLVIIYIVFISLGLPDGVFGGAWPAIYGSINAAAGIGGVISLLSTAMTIISSLMTSWLSKKLGTGLLLTVSTALTVVGLVGFAGSHEIAWLFLFSIPLGLGAGAIDSALNHYVATHFEAHHMNWLHASWGIGATMGPIIYTIAYASTHNWRSGYIAIGIIQAAIMALLLFSLPLWKKVHTHAARGEEEVVPSDVSFIQLLQEKRALLAFVSFLLYVGVEVMLGIWLGTYLVNVQGVSLELAALFTSLFYAAITIGRVVAGFIVMRVDNLHLIRYGTLIALLGAVLVVTDFAPAFTIIGIGLIGLGLAPVYPGMIHETPERFGKHKAAKVMSLQMVGGYVGATALPPLVGLLSGTFSFSIVMSMALGAIVLLFIATEVMNKLTNFK